jgi:hypothetical protein
MYEIQAEAKQRVYQPEPEKPNWAPGSMEWRAEQEKLKQNSGS